MIILGLAIATCEHHAAALVIDGQIIGAAEEERFNGIKHYGWSPDGRPVANLCNDPDLTINDALCRGVLGWLLGSRGLTLADVDVVALNGIPHRHTGSRACIRDGRYVFVPHHLAHAAVAARTSPFAECNVLTVDGRGEYETAALFAYRGGEFRRLAELPAGEGRSIGGAYETVTRALGFGPHGQGQTMALASFVPGRPERLADGFAIQSFDRYTLDEHRLQELALSRVEAGASPDRDEARALAADVQGATEQAMIALARDGQARDPSPNWAIAGGVALNCRANTAVRDALAVDIWVPSSAHDGGTALGAALEAAHILGEPPCGLVANAGLGPDLDDADCERALRDAGLEPAAAEDAVAGAAARLADGQVLGWVQGRMEYGPRALGHRSIVAHPGSPGVQDRVNAIKDRQAWRPFGPSVLAEHVSDWFEDDRFGPFMTFTSQVLPDRRESVSGIVHVDGSTRPQPIDEHAHPAWRRLVQGFHGATGIPMVLNTSFNGRGEPIVNGPEAAIASARQLGLDALVLGRWLVDL